MDSGLQFASTTDGDSPYFKFKVGFLHRTVRDFLVKSLKTLEFFSINRGSSVSLSIAPVKAAVAQLKFGSLTRNMPFHDKALGELFLYTRNAAKPAVSHSKDAAVIDGLLETAERVYDEITQNVAAYGPHPIPFLGMAAQSGHTSFLERKFSAGLSLGAIEKSDDESLYRTDHNWARQYSLSEGGSNHQILKLAHSFRLTGIKPKRVTTRHPLLDCALTPLSSSDAPYIDTIQLLLLQGASYSQEFAVRGDNYGTVWVQDALLQNEPLFAVAYDVLCRLRATPPQFDFARRMWHGSSSTVAPDLRKFYRSGIYLTSLSPTAPVSPWEELKVATKLNTVTLRVAFLVATCRLGTYNVDQAATRSPGRDLGQFGVGIGASPGNRGPRKRFGARDHRGDRLDHLDPFPLAIIPIPAGETARFRLHRAREPATRSPVDEPAHEQPIDPRHLVRVEEERELAVHVQLGVRAAVVAESFPGAGLSEFPPAVCGSSWRPKGPLSLGLRRALRWGPPVGLRSIPGQAARCRRAVGSYASLE
ncbi:hypothetical protein PG988_007637 [Apiospora saccharicola]